MPKIQFFFPQFYEFTGEWFILDIGLSLQYYSETGTQYYLLDSEFVSSLLKSRSKFAHKGLFGHALMLCGSKGKGGAAVLSGAAALRSGCGLLTMQVPSSLLPIIQSQIPEAMALADQSPDFISDTPDNSHFKAIGIGPGIGLNSHTLAVFRKLLEKNRNAMVIDADALNLLAENSDLWSLIPENSILTPHIKEFDRIAGPSRSDMERHQKQKSLARDKNVLVVLKGAYTCICAPDGNSYFNQTGNPGMAKGGSGDVLTGMLTSLLASGYSPLETSLLGVYIHGLAGDLAAEELGETGMIAGDIIRYIPYAFRALEINERY
jgi:NAD(P)H-hydrate epimerase